ncbi:MAG: tyrosine-type recombinase/integrase [archaeon]|nr:tyrosine-type recombinase/integrase [archaeon]
MKKREILDGITTLLDLGKRSQKTKDVYLLYINKYLTFLEKDNKKVEETTVNDILRFMKNYSNSSPITLNTIKVSLGFLYIKILRNKKIIEDVKEIIPRIKIPEREVICLPHETIIKFINSMEMPYQIIFKTQYICGLRIDEISKLKIKDVLEKKVIGKGNKERKIFLPDYLQKELLEFSKKYNIKKDHVFFYNTRNLQNQFKKYIIKNELDPNIYTPHSLRRSFATNMLKNGNSLNNVRKWLGHQNINTTQKYLGDEENKDDKGLYF